MMDFLKAYPFITIEQYLWKIPIRMIRIMSADATQVIYLSEKQQERFKEIKQTDPRYVKVYTEKDLDDFDKALGLI